MANKNFDINENLVTQTSVTNKVVQPVNEKVDTPVINKKVSLKRNVPNVVSIPKLPFPALFIDLMSEYIDKSTVNDNSILKYLIEPSSKLIEKEIIVCELFVLLDRLMNALESKSEKKILLKSLEQALVVLDLDIKSINPNVKEKKNISNSC